MLAMDLPFAWLTFGLLFVILFLLFQSYRDATKKVAGFPFYHFVPKLIYDQVTGKIPEGVPFTSHVCQVVTDACKQHLNEGLFMTYLPEPTLFVYSEEAMKFFSNEKLTLDKSSVYEIVQDGMGAGLATSNGVRWKTHRKLINPAFHLGMLKDKIPLFNEHAAALVKDMEVLASRPCVELLEVLKSNYFNALSESLFGLKQTEENKEGNLKILSLIDSFAEMAEMRLYRTWLRGKFSLHILPSGRKYLKQKKEFQQFITKMINDMKQKAASNKTTDSDHCSNHLRKSLAYILLSQHLNDPSFSFQDLHDEVRTMLITGYDTLTYSTLWCLFMLGLHPEVQEKAFNEVQSTADSYITYEDSCNLTYLEAVIMGIY